jgi:hypothetical protein
MLRVVMLRVANNSVVLSGIMMNVVILGDVASDHRYLKKSKLLKLCACY